MTDFTITISNTMNVFGISPTNQWGVMVWGIDNWGPSEIFQKDVFKVVVDAQAMTTAYIKDITHTITNTLSFIDAIAKIPTVTFSDTLNLSGNTPTIVEYDGNNYQYIWTKPTVNVDLKVISSYSSTVNASDTYSGTVNTSTTWTEL